VSGWPHRSTLRAAGAFAALALARIVVTAFSFSIANQRKTTMPLPQPMRKVRIESNGKADGTFVYDAVNGERLDWIKNIRLDVNADRVACELTVLVQVVEIHADAVPLDEVVLAPVAADAKLPPCETVEVDMECAADVEKPKKGQSPWPFRSYVIGPAK
jgi:hypothetical protein